MPRRRFGFKPKLSATLRANDAAMRFLVPDCPPELLNNLPPKKERAAPRDLEGPVVAAISELLAVHPRVIWAARFNSGAASYEAKSGRYAPVWFHKFLRMPAPMRMPDFFGICRESQLMIDCGIPTALMAIEAKAPLWTKPRDDREREQAAFLRMIRDAGGIALFATDVSQVADALRD